MDSDKIKLLIHRIGLNNNLQDHIVNKIYNSQYKFTRKTITDLVINEDITEEEFSQLKTNFIYKGLGKIYTNFTIFNKIRKQREYLKQRHKNKREENERTSIESGTN